MIDIKDIQGNVIYTTEINIGAKRKFQLMKEDYITLPFSLEAPLDFGLGSYVDIDEGLFEVVDLQKPTLNNSTGGYDYQLRFDAYYWKWKNKIFKFTPEVGGQEASWSLTASLDVHLGVFLKNLEALGYTYRGIGFKFSIDATVENKAMPLTYNNTNMIDALSAMAEAWKCEWWVEDEYICFGRCEKGEAVDFEIGVNVAGMTSSASQSTYATRIYAFGSTRNIPSDYRPVESESVIGGIAQKRLMLPKGRPYIDAYDNMSEEEAIEEVVIFDEIYPKMEADIDSVSTYESTKNNEDGTTTTETFYRFTDNGITFSEDYILEGEELKVQFTSGSLNGMEFGLVFNPEGKAEKKDDSSWNPEAQLFEIVANEDYGRKLPDSTLNPKIGDTFILIGWDSSKIASLGLVAKAEEELLNEALKLSAKRKIDPSTYNCKMYSNYMYALPMFQAGDRVNLINSAFFKEGRQSRIVGYEYCLDLPFDNPVFIVGETLAYSRIGALENKLDSIIVNGIKYEGNESNLNRYLRKDRDDRSRGMIASDKGVEVGRFTTGMIGGNGAKMYVDVNGKTIVEADKAYFREEMLVPKITFNSIDVVSGEQAATFAFGTIKSVDTERQIATLDLLDDEYGTLHEYDILRGTFHRLEGGNNTEYNLDKNGFHNYSGFSTSYFTPTEIIANEKGYMEFRYSLQDSDTMHPCAGMKFYAYGNFVDENRRAMTYQTREYTRRLRDVKTWVIDPNNNIAKQDGNLNNLEIGGMKMSGYGTFETNSYLMGTQIQFTPDQLEELKGLNGADAYSVSLSSNYGTIKIDEEGKITSGMLSAFNVTTGSMNVVTGENNVVTTDFSLRTVIQAAKGGVPLYYSAGMEEGTYMAVLSSVGCMATINGGVVTITDITDLNNACVTIVVNCEGNYGVEQEYRIVALKDGDSSEIEIIYSKEEEPVMPEEVHPYIDDDVWSHASSKDNIWMAVSTRKNNTWTPWVVSRVKGKDAVSYEITPPALNLRETLTGTIVPTATTFTCYQSNEKERKPISATWGIKGRNTGETDWVTFSYSHKGETMTFSPNQQNRYDEYLITAVPEGQQTALEVQVLSTKEKKGVIPRYCGHYKSGERYYYNDDYRDIVVYGGSVFQVYPYNPSGYVTSVPNDNLEEGSNDGSWEKANKFSFVAMDTALIDNANIAGFTFHAKSEDANGNPLGQMVSSNGKIILDTENEKITATNADISGSITAGEMSFNVCVGNGGSTWQDLTNYGLASGSGTYVLPRITEGKTLQIRAICANYSRTAVPFGFKTTDGSYIYTKPDWSDSFTQHQNVALDYNRLYTFTSAYDSIAQRWVWILSEGMGASDAGQSLMLIDDKLSETSINPVQNKVITAELKKYVTLEGKQTISGEKNFTGGLKVNGSPIVYDPAGYWKFVGDMVVTGGITMYANEGQYTPSTIMDAVNVDGSTIKKVNGVLMINPDIDFGGGVTSWLELMDKPNTIEGYGIRDAKISGRTITLGSNSMTVYAPDYSGNANQVLVSGGSGEVPYWVNQASITAGACSGNAATATTASKLSTTSKTAWGQTYWTSNGVPTNISGSISNTGNITPQSDSTYTVGTDGNGYKCFYAQGSSTDVGMIATGSNYKLGFIIGQGNSNRGIYDFTNNSWLMYRDDSSNVYFPQGLVGIGTTDPKSKLHVAGSVQADNKFALTNADSGSATTGYSQGGVMILRHSTTGGTILSADNETLYLRPKGSTDGTSQCTITAGGNMLVSGGITMYSDERKKTILNHVELSLDEVAGAPLIEHYYNEDDKKTTHVGSIAQYWAGLNDWFCKEDENGFYTMEIQNAALASSISIAREFVRYKKEVAEEIRLLKEEIELLKRK